MPQLGTSWGADWLWSAPLVVLTTLLHVFGLGLITGGIARAVERETKRYRFLVRLAAGMGVAVVSATALHWLEAALWAAAFRALGALPDYKDAMLYSLGAITTFGHADVALAPHWRMMGSIEALNGMLLFGLTTAFLFALIQRVWRLGPA